MMPRRELGQSGACWAAFYAAQGLSAPEIAAKHKVDAHPQTVRKMLSRVGISIREADRAAEGRLIVEKITPATMRFFEDLAVKRATPVEGLLWQIAEAIANDPDGERLFANILDIDAG